MYLAAVVDKCATLVRASRTLELILRTSLIDIPRFIARVVSENAWVLGLDATKGCSLIELSGRGGKRCGKFHELYS